MANGHSAAYGGGRTEVERILTNLQEGIHIVEKGLNVVEPNVGHVQNVVASVTLGIRSLRTHLDNNSSEDASSAAGELLFTIKEVARAVRETLFALFHRGVSELRSMLGFSHQGTFDHYPTLQSPHFKRWDGPSAGTLNLRFALYIGHKTTNLAYLFCDVCGEHRLGVYNKRKVLPYISLAYLYVSEKMVICIQAQGNRHCTVQRKGTTRSPVTLWKV